jgi:hypothetical protein
MSADTPFELPPDESSHRQKRETLSGRTLFFILVGLLVAVVMGFVIYDRGDAYYARKKYESLEQEHMRLLDQRAGTAGTAEGDRIDRRLSEIRYEQQEMLRRHPHLGR